MSEYAYRFPICTIELISFIASIISVNDVCAYVVCVCVEEDRLDCCEIIGRPVYTDSYKQRITNIQRMHLYLCLCGYVYH